MDVTEFIKLMTGRRTGRDLLIQRASDIICCDDSTQLFLKLTLELMNCGQHVKWLIADVQYNILINEYACVEIKGSISTKA